MAEELSKAAIIAALARLNDELEASGVRGEICLFGGAVMVLVFDARPTTRDVDAVFRPIEEFRRAAEAVREEQGLGENWLNDRVKGWTSDRGETTTDGLPQFSHLRITRPTASYLLAMKALAARASGPENKGDRDDIRALIKHLALTAPEAVFEIIAQFYPTRHVLPKTEYLVREILDECETT